MTLPDLRIFFAPRRYRRSEDPMDSKVRRRPRSHASTPVVIVPTQSPDAIERRQQIREALHDAKAVTVRGRPRGQKKAS